MPKFTFSCEVTVSAITHVEADTEEEALAIAKERSVTIGTSWNNDEADDEWSITEADGEPTNIVLSDTSDES